MKKLLAILIFTGLLASTNLIAQSVGIGTDTPDSSAVLELKSDHKGFLPPSVALIASNNTLPITNPAIGLLVYNTASSGSSPVNVKPGYHYWDGSKWVAVVNKANNYGDMQYWDGSRWVIIPLGLNGQVLTICNGIPFWGNGSCQTNLNLQPANNNYELSFTNYDPNQLANGGGPQFAIQAWTAFGNSLITREILKFDLSSIPVNAVIDSAKLYLYYSDNPLGGNTVDAHSGSNNSCLIQRITSNWTLPCPYSWNNPPSVTTSNQAIIPQSATATDNNIITVTALIKDMLLNSNNGFLIRLQNEVTYNIRQYTASFNSNTAKRPKLSIYYH